MAARGSEQPALAVLSNAGGADVGAQRFGERMVVRHRVLLAAIFVQPDRPPRRRTAANPRPSLQGRVELRAAGFEVDADKVLA